MKAYLAGMNQLPFNFPGIVYRKAILSRENMLGTLDKVICCRRKVRDLFYFSFTFKNKI
jgi:hypothetical protein